MTGRQKFLKAVYPLIMGAKQLFGRNKIKGNTAKAGPPVSFYSLEAVANNGDTIDFDRFKGKKVLLVNTASDCGYTGQYEELEKLYREYGKTLVVLGFPANDFKEQEKGTDQEIAQFCKVNYGVTFPIMKKSTVVKGNQQNAVFGWLTDKTRNGWNEQAPEWNFSKYLVSENGVLLDYFATPVSPLSKEVIAAIESK
jgi:glutathione peroxidase